MNLEPFTLPDTESRANAKHITWMRCALAIAKLSTCRRRSVGCVLVDKAGHVMSTGYNGAAAGQRHCTDVACPGAGFPPGEGLDKCVAIHAEANALIQCRDHQSIGIAYVTASPCLHCVKLLLNTSCRAIYFAEHYAHSEAITFWQNANRIAFLVPNLV